MNILIANDATVANHFRKDGWTNSISLFGGKKLMNVLATLAVVQNDTDLGESYDEVLDETIDTLISAQIDRRNEDGAPREPDQGQIDSIKDYLRYGVKTLRPYMPSGGSLELVNYLTDPKSEILYLIVRYHPNDEHSDKAFASPSIRG